MVAGNAKERAEWQERLATIERAPLTAVPESAEPTTAPVEEEATPETAAVAERRGGPGGGPGRGRGNPLATLMQDPEFARAMLTQQKGALDQRYADLFRRLNLSPAQVDQLKNLLLERQSAAADVMAAAREQGLDGRESREELRKMVQETQAAADEKIRAMLGENAYAEYKTYEQTQTQRNLVNQLENKLSYTGSPLQSSQMDQLVRILAESSQNARNAAGNQGFAIRGMDGGGPVVMGGGGSTQITDDVIARAQSVLTQAQLQGLKQMQAEQEAQRTMSEAMRNASRANRPGAATTTP